MSCSNRLRYVAGRFSLLTRRKFSCRITKIERGNFSKVTDSDVTAFRSIVGNDMITDPGDMELYNIDWMRRYQGNSSVVLKPRSTNQVSQLLEYCNERKIITSGGSIPVFDEVIVSMSLMNKVISLDEVAGVLVCEAGCILESLNDMLSDKGLVMPLDLAAKGSCQIGGNISTNAGGIRFMRYGSLHGSVLGIKTIRYWQTEVYWTVYQHTGKITQNDQLYKDCANLPVARLLGHSVPQCKCYDLKQLFIGAEGTLGIITELAMVVPPKPKAVNVALLSCESFDKVKQIIVEAKSMLGEILSATELMDSETMELVVEQLKLVNPLNESSFYILIETSGSDEEHDRQKLNVFLESVFKEGIITNGTIAGSMKEMKAIWELRDEVSSAILSKLRQEGKKSYHYDLSLSLDDFYTIVTDMRKRFSDCITMGHGHIGDGNLHLGIMSDNEIKGVDSYVFEWTKNHRGSISAEHGLGVNKNHLIACYSKSQKVMQFMSNVKKLFDPKGILNPYKTLP